MCQNEYDEWLLYIDAKLRTNNLSDMDMKCLKYIESCNTWNELASLYMWKCVCNIDLLQEQTDPYSCKTCASLLLFDHTTSECICPNCSVSEFCVEASNHNMIFFSGNISTKTFYDTEKNFEKLVTTLSMSLSTFISRGEVNSVIENISAEEGVKVTSKKQISTFLKSKRHKNLYWESARLYKILLSNEMGEDVNLGGNGVILVHEKKEIMRLFRIFFKYYRKFPPKGRMSLIHRGFLLYKICERKAYFHILDYIKLPKMSQTMMSLEKIYKDVEDKILAFEEYEVYA